MITSCRKNKPERRSRLMFIYALAGSHESPWNFFHSEAYDDFLSHTMT